MAYKMAFERFSSINALLRTNEKRELNKAFKGETHPSSEKGDEGFSGTASYEEAKRLIELGWDEPLGQIKKETGLKPVKTNTQADRRKPTTGIVGYSPCVPNAIMGLPNSMISTETIKQKVKAVTLIYGPTVNCGWSTSEITECGITMLKIINMLELQGVRVKLAIEGMSAQEGNDVSIMWVDVKDWREAIDLKKITFPVAHPSMLRRIGFKWLETCPQVTNSRYTRGYGSPLGNKKYEDVMKIYNEQSILKENEYFISAQLCKDCDQDVDTIMKRAGMSALKLQIEKRGA